MKSLEAMDTIFDTEGLLKREEALNIPDMEMSLNAIDEMTLETQRLIDEGSLPPLKDIEIDSNGILSLSNTLEDDIKLLDDNLSQAEKNKIIAGKLGLLNDKKMSSKKYKSKKSKKGKRRTK